MTVNMYALVVISLTMLVASIPAHPAVDVDARDGADSGKPGTVCNCCRDVLAFGKHN